jgi:hypothetical protein
MTQDEFRAAMNAAKRERRLLWLTDGQVSGIALGYDSGSDEVVFDKNIRAPLVGMREDKP